MSNVLILKLSTGEEVIGRIVNESDDTYQIEFGLLLNYQLQDEGKIAFGFLPYSPLSNKDKRINKSHVVWSAEPADGLKDAYNKATGQIMTPSDKIITPPKGLIIG